MAAALSVMAKVPPERMGAEAPPLRMGAKVPLVRMGARVPLAQTGESQTVALAQPSSPQGIPDTAHVWLPTCGSPTEVTNPGRTPTIPGLPVPRLRLAPTLLATPRVPSTLVSDDNRLPRMASRRPTDRHPWPREQSSPAGVDAQTSGIPSPIRSGYPRTESWRNQRIRRYFP
jgi:hypothetical protein